MQAVDELGQLLLAGFGGVDRLPVLNGRHRPILGRGHQLLLLRLHLFSLFHIHLLTSRDPVELGSLDAYFVLGFDKILELLFIIFEGPAELKLAISLKKKFLRIICSKEFPPKFFRATFCSTVDFWKNILLKRISIFFSTPDLKNILLKRISTEILLSISLTPDLKKILLKRISTEILSANFCSTSDFLKRISTEILSGNLFNLRFFD